MIPYLVSTLSLLDSNPRILESVPNTLPCTWPGLAPMTITSWPMNGVLLLFRLLLHIRMAPRSTTSSDPNTWTSRSRSLSRRRSKRVEAMSWQSHGSFDGGKLFLS